MNVILFIIWIMYDILMLVRCEISMGNSFNYEKRYNYGLGHRPIENYRRVAAKSKHSGFFDNNPHPASLPPVIGTQYPTPYRSIYQGSRKPGDTRVYNHHFDYEPKILGHQISSNGLFNCIISHLAVETDTAIPILLRGGVSYRYFTVIVKAKAGVRLKGKIRAYCQNPPDEGIDINANVDNKRK
ncbi:uncharacterized protein LOC113236880 [Hyposmocoma kahamanoa]|uniref:uncharacterized protein LOC113236880 n=1 Tax=Hyposmocoma kahamanoa TaxID=1477025 RepID=UPI000E6DA167|nr:uncharacterized protein LOC113236880 [Hyposmocoma kahamanoa]